MPPFGSGDSCRGVRSVATLSIRMTVNLIESNGVERMKTTEIVDKIESGKLTKDELIIIAEAYTHAISEGNHG